MADEIVVPLDRPTAAPEKTETPTYLTKEEFGKTAAMLRGMKEENATLKSIIESIVEKGDDGSYKLKVNAPVKKEEPSKEPEWKTEVNALKTEIAKRDKLIAEKDTAAHTAAKRSAIVDELTKHNAVNPTRDAVHLYDAVKANSEGKYVVYSKDENGLDVETPLDKHVSGWLKGNPELVRATGKAGSGTPASALSSNMGGLDIANMSMAEYAKARPEILKNTRGF
jgi:hypothetical protein